MIPTLHSLNKALRALAAALLLACCIPAADAAGEVVRLVVTVTNSVDGITTNGTATLTVNGDTRTATNNVAQDPTKFWLGTNSWLKAATNLYHHAQIYKFGSGASLLSVRMTGTNTIEFTAQPNQAIAASLGGVWGTLTISTNNATNQIPVVVPAATMSPSTQTNIGAGLVDYINAASNSLATGAVAMVQFVDRSTGQTVSNKTLTHTVIEGGRLVGVTNLTGTNVALTNATLRLAVITGGDFTGIITAVSNGIIYATVLDGVRPTNVYGLAGAIHQIIGGQWTNGTLQTPTLVSPSLSNATIFGNTTITGATLNLIGSGVNNFISLTATSTIAAVGPIIYMARENGITNAVDAGDVLGLIGFTGWGTTAQKVGARIRAIPMETFTDSTAGTILLFETTPSGSTTPVGRLHIGNDGLITISNMLQVVVAVTNLTVAGANKWQGDLSYSRYSNSGIINGNNSGILIGTNVVVELSGGTTIAQYAGFVASRDGDYRIVRMSGAVTNVIVDANDPVWSPDGTAARRITTGTGGALLLTNQPSWIKMMYRTASTSWEVLDHSR